MDRRARQTAQGGHSTRHCRPGREPALHPPDDGVAEVVLECYLAGLAARQAKVPGGRLVERPRAAKAFYVSPFYAVEGGVYRMRLPEPDERLGVSTLEQLERAAHDGRLAQAGVGPKRLRGLIDALAGRLSRSRLAEPEIELPEQTLTLPHTQLDSVGLFDPSRQCLAIPQVHAHSRIARPGTQYAIDLLNVLRLQPARPARALSLG